MISPTLPRKRRPSSEPSPTRQPAEPIVPIKPSAEKGDAYRRRRPRRTLGCAARRSDQGRVAKRLYDVRREIPGRPPRCLAGSRPPAPPPDRRQRTRAPTPPYPPHLVAPPP